MVRNDIILSWVFFLLPVCVRVCVCARAPLVSGRWYHRGTWQVGSGGSAASSQCLSNAHFLPHIGTGEESVHTYQQMVQAIDELVRKTFQDWTSTLDKDCVRRLDTPLLRISQEKAGMLDVNFDKYETHPASLPLCPSCPWHNSLLLPRLLTPISGFLSPFF